MRMRHDRNWPRRRGGRQLLALTAAGLAAITVAVGLLGDHVVRTATGAGARAPAWRGGTTPCRQDPMVHVHHPSRFIVLAGCATVDGTVQQVRRDPADGDVKMLVKVDPRYRRFLRPSNRGLLPAAVIPPDVPTVRIPQSGQHVTFHGAWVVDRNKRNLAAMHPVWKIQVSSDSTSPSPPLEASPSKPAGQRLLVRMKAPRSVPVGGAMDIPIRVQALDRGARRPVPEASLFLEVTAEDGRGVQWKAAFTNTLGFARVTLVALQHPGSFTLWLYADKLGRSAVLSAPFRVRRR
jgi:hypothetical protein